MSKKYYNKLVRDKIPEIIGKDGAKCVVSKIEGKELKSALKYKLREETNEFVESDMEIEEMADVFEVIDKILEMNDWTLEDVRKAQDEKREKRGGFSEGLYLVCVER